MDRREGLLQQLEEDEKDGFVTKMTLKEARSRWPDSLRIAAMGAVEQPGREGGKHFDCKMLEPKWHPSDLSL